jgi:mannose-6-phosphate isomerase-like protein (cupin superfamily)
VAAGGSRGCQAQVELGSQTGVIMQTTERIQHGNELLAIIIRSEWRTEGIEFFTPAEFSQQLAYMNRPAGYKISPHVHNKIQREVFYTQEVLFIRKGKLKVSFYDEAHRLIADSILDSGDVILLASGGHGFEMLEQTEIIEVKQGPYAGEQDKTRFESEDG